ncbi:MAG: Zn-dependent protease with chaperone function [Planctomycetaceae bacterium]|jgi:Zn-dependent protease with chaperone function
MFDGDLLDDDEFPGGVFSDEIDGGRAGAHIRLGDRGITARTSEGREFVITYSDCDLELGGDSGRMVFCRTADRTLTFFCEDRRFPEALKRAAVGELFEQVDTILIAGNRQRWVGRMGLWVTLAVCAVALVGAYYGVVALARVAIKSVPIVVDQEIGEAALPAVLSEFGEEIKSPKALDAVQRIVDRLAPHATVRGVNYRVLIVDSNVDNALALPGGTILVFRGLIDTMDSTEQLSAVIAHEMSHVTLRHHLTQIARSVGIVAAVNIVIGDVGGIVAIGSEVLQNAALNNYSQVQETEADLEGARMMHEAGIDPQAMIQMLDNLPDVHLHGALSWLSTHPNSDERIRSVQQFLDEAEPRDYSQLDFRLEELRGLLDETQAEQPIDDEPGDDNIENIQLPDDSPKPETDAEEEVESKD